MARPPKGKPLTLRPIRLDDDVWAECQRLRDAYGTINEVLSAALAALRMLPPPVRDGMINQGCGNQDPDVPLSQTVKKGLLETLPPEFTDNPCFQSGLAWGKATQARQAKSEPWKRGPRPEGDKTR